MGTTATITIDRMVKEDLDQVMDIEQASFSMPWSRNLFLAEFRNRPVSLMLVALAPGEVRQVVGYIVCWTFVDELHILDLATRPDVRRKGIARQLVLATLSETYRWGARKAFLEVRESNRAALALYQGLGFVRTAVREEYYDLPIENAVVMIMEIEAFRRLVGHGNSLI
jgi:ribosomal-protein-alanine N-acetyltransferase